MLEIAILTVFPLAMLVAASMDLFTMTIPNRISLALIAGFVLLAPFVGLGWQDILAHIGVGAALLVVGMGLFALGWMGGGDAKLLAATGLWLGWGMQLLTYATIASVFGALLTLMLLLYRFSPLPPLAVRFAFAIRLHDKKEGIPYGIALAAAGLVVYPHTIWMTSLT